MNVQNGKTLPRILLALLLCLSAAACTKQDGEGGKTDAETVVTVEAENKAQEEEADGFPSPAPKAAEEAGVGERQENDGIITVYTTEIPENSDEEIPVLYTDDLSLLEGMGPADSSYGSVSYTHLTLPTN